MGLLGSVFKIGASILGGSSSKKASKKAQAEQIAFLNRGIDTLNTQFGKAEDLSQPWTGGGASAQSELLNLLGLSSPGTEKVDWEAYGRAYPGLAAYYTSHNGQNLFAKGDSMSFADYAKAHYDKYGSAAGFDLTPFTTMEGASTANQGAAIESLKESPLYQALFRNGVDTTLANASATGGLRGGNTQDALARVGTDTLAKVYQDRISNLGGVSGLGLQAVTGLEGLGAANAESIASLFGKQGDVNASGILQRAAIKSNMFNNIAGAVGELDGNGSLARLVSKVGIVI